MKNLIALGVLVSLILGACTKDTCTNTMTYDRYDPVYVLPEEYRIEISAGSSQELVNPGKIYFYKNYILINEPRVGFHVINNQNPSNPVNEMFVKVPGNVDMAIMNDVLYLDSYTDLLAVDVSDITNPRLLERKENVFTSFYHSGPDGLLSHYEKSEESQTIDCSDSNWGSWFWRRGGIAEDGSVFIDRNFAGNNSIGSSGSGAPVQIGQGGSFARFTITHWHLYAIGDRELYSFPIQSNGALGMTNKVNVSWGIETIFPFNDFLFIGANNGLHIMGLENPSQPRYISEFSHANACDPVVVQDDIAFVTLRNGNECQGFINQLEVIDVKDVLRPRLLHVFPMQNPHGLAVEGDYLYICEGKFGLKVFEIKELGKIGQNLKLHKTDLHAWDAIAVKDKFLLVIGEDGFYQYDNSDPTDLKLLSVIKAKR